jgi:MinD-like ATPase involved in chromosome partitioning or flagellar assembly/Tfp pilus assembly protein PilF
MTQRPRTFTFYSYKGGVGRSMALLNVAYTLHSMGRHVLIVDLDLEAPGVSGFLRRNDELAPHEADKPDVVDLLKDVLPLARWQLGDASRPEVPVLANYLREVKPEKFAEPQNARFRRTRLDVLCASDERDYTNRLAALDIASLTAEDLAETGNVLREIFFRHQFPWAWQEDHEDQPTRYDYILIDSRTGFTETSGLCIGPLADRLVIFCGLNDQNINGTAEFLRVVGLKAGPRATPWDDADEIEDTTRAPSLGDKPSLLVASPVPAGEMDLKQARFQEMERVLKLPPAHHISYHPRLSLYETVFLRDYPREIITREYRELTDSILSLVGDHPGQLQALLHPRELSQHTAKLGDTSLILRFGAAVDEEHANRFAEVHRLFGDHYASQAKSSKALQSKELFIAADERYRAACLLNPDFHEALSNWGSSLLEQAKQKFGADAEKLLAASIDKSRGALALKQDSPETWNNWGSALLEQAKLATKENGVRDGLIADAVQKYEQALSIDSRYSQALANLGFAFTEKARRKSDAEADALLAAAEEKFKTALSIKPDIIEVLGNWGVALLDRAKRKSGQEAEKLMAEALEKFQRALAINPYELNILLNFACVAALRGDSIECVRWLERALASGHHLTREKIEPESDFDRVRETPEFKKFMAKLPA